MKPPSDEDLILHYYGESERPEAIEEALRSPEVAARWQGLREVLDAVPRAVEPPARDAEWTVALWRGVRSRLGEPAGAAGGLRRFPDLRGGPWRWAAAAALALLLGASFWAGGLWRQRSEGGVAAGEEAPRVLLLAVADHFDRTEILLAELANRDDGQGDVSVEREWAAELATASRFYRRAAQRSGEPEVAWVLSELEPVLVELAHAPEELGDVELAELRARLERGDLLFKVRVVGSRLKDETLTGAGSGADA